MPSSGVALGIESIGHAGARPGAEHVDLRLREAAQGFEALLWEEVLRAALPDGLSQDAGVAGSLYSGLEVQALADALARAGGAGLWRTLIQEMAPARAQNRIGLGSAGD
jgi:Rod binding domain-containing protein